MRRSLVAQRLQIFELLLNHVLLGSWPEVPLWEVESLSSSPAIWKVDIDGAVFSNRIHAGSSTSISRNSHVGERTAP